MTILGIDAGATHVRYGLVADGTPSQGQRERSRIGSAEELATQCKEIADKFPDASAVGIATPGPLDKDGILHNPPNFAGWGTVNFKALLARTLNRPFTYERDSVAALYGEWKLGVAKGKKNVVLLTLGTGIGGAALVDGKILRGSHGFSGELGHIFVGPPGRTCGLGHDGCAEAWGSGRALEAGVSVDQATDAFVRLLKSLELVFDPELIVLSGGILNRQDYLDLVMNKTKLIGQQTSVRVAKLGEWAGVVGAVLLATKASKEGE
jgi:predicted NBD/HSP70 family sugar kinase